MGSTDPERVAQVHASQPEYTEGQVRDRRASTRPLLHWETILILAGVGALVAVFAGSIAWRIFT
ncbi:MAG: hypothetical protein IH609_07405 [Dehalococcoidia bacterium]|nr:hypothetical protein [Dehalococcoidia bacterium]